MARTLRKSTPAIPESELLAAIQMLTDEVRVLRDAVDELREEVQWGNHNRDGESPLAADRHIHDCSLDSPPAEFATNMPDEKASDQTPAKLIATRGVPRKQGELFH